MTNNNNSIVSNTKRITITVNKDEYEAFKANKYKEGKSGQLLAYMALEKYGLFHQPSASHKRIKR
jgi:hypothetical protein